MIIAAYDPTLVKRSAVERSFLVFVGFRELYEETGCTQGGSLHAFSMGHRHEYLKTGADSFAGLWLGHARIVRIFDRL